MKNSIVCVGDLNVDHQGEQKVAKAISTKLGGKSVDILKVGHHGFQYSSARETLDLMKPKYAVTATCGSSYNPFSRYYASTQYNTIYYDLQYAKSREPRIKGDGDRISFYVSFQWRDKH